MLCQSYATVAGCKVQLQRWRGLSDQVQGVTGRQTHSQRFLDASCGKRCQAVTK